MNIPIMVIIIVSSLFVDIWAKPKRDTESLRKSYFALCAFGGVSEG